MGFSPNLLLHSSKPVRAVFQALPRSKQIGLFLSGLRGLPIFLSRMTICALWTWSTMTEESVRSSILLFWLPKFTNHSLRATVATRLFKAGVDGQLGTGRCWWVERRLLMILNFGHSFWAVLFSCFLMFILCTVVGVHDGSSDEN